MKLNRMFEMLYILLYREVVSAAEFAEYFNVSTRTIYRYVDELSLANIPIYMKKGKNGGISLLPDYTLNKVFLSDDEKSEIVASLRAFTNLQNEKNSQSTINKLLGLFKSTQADWLEVDFSRWKDRKISKDTFDLIKSAIIFSEKLKLDYYNLKNQRIVRVVRPIKLLYKSMDWYLYGYCETREDYRFFKLKRMKSVSMTGEKFENNLKDTLPLNLDYSENKDEKIEVILEIDSALSFYVVEEYENYEQNSKGNYIVSLKIGVDELLSNILSYGSFCKVLSPEFVVDLVREELKNNLNKYL
ncbi:Predicted DNA-binding transcriptional regulator YafY, contains an HTH and WYL domains [Anaerosphaera aminiphila DSM 21120]|uniref:Predicted DNA-binding transcriptional regulator YafY, contains an HTH and WYL domains n=1 Tax=Anaerosphaera aminiphila DSM 21120 TaxID=1120995 RepID=A0A1M5R7W8_9FIRM|nr:YafY family protein [Anaerosphaera aminiphila]SHH22412.1 Predicted DNA-binding transcriptional regulator YafY, contains an HTH and WYL domains [Anaerosphaera aminiphila DSM 21120]